MRCRRFLRDWFSIGWLLGSFLVSCPLPLAASSEAAGVPPDRVDALMASIALYPDPLLAKFLIAATYPLEVDEAERWLRLHNSLTGTALNHAIAGQPWDDSVKDLAHVPAVLSMMDDRLEWTQNLGDTFLAQPADVFASVQRLRGMALKARTLHSTSQQNVTGQQKEIVIEPAVPGVIDVPFYDPQVAYGEWSHPMYPPMWWTAPRGYTYGSGIGFMTGIGVPVDFWNDTVEWETGRVVVNKAVGVRNNNRVAESLWIHDPKHRRFVSYSTPRLRLRYGREFPSDGETRDSFRGNDRKDQLLGVERTKRTRERTVQAHAAWSEARPGSRLSVFEDIDQAASERLFSRRGNASISIARHDNSHFPIGELALAAAESDTVAAR